MRFVIGLIMLMLSIDILPMLDILVGPEGVIDAKAGSRGISWGRWTWFDHVDSMEGIYAIHAATLVANFLFMIGYRSRTMGLISVLASAALYQRNGWFMNGGDRLTREFALYISLVPCGAACSVDAWLARRKAARKGLSTAYSALVPIFSHRLVQMQLCFMYGTSGLDKAATRSWSGGSALFYSLSSENYHRSRALVEPFLTTELGQWLCEVGTYITLYWEIGFVFLVLWRPTRILALLLGVGVHLSIHVLMVVAFFSFISMWSYMSFLRYDWVEVLQEKWQARRAHASVVRTAEE